jgi:hypothetical protein
MVFLLPFTLSQGVTARASADALFWCLSAANRTISALKPAILPHGGINALGI